MPNLFDDLNKRGLIKWGGVQSSDYGIVVQDCPAFDKPRRKQTVFNVAGRNGSVLFQEDAFEDTTRSYNIWIDEQTEEDSGGTETGRLDQRVADFTAWLFSKKGYQELEDNFEPDFYRLAYYSGGNDVSNELIMYGKSTLTFTCRPERFLISGKTPVTVTNGAIMTNPTLFASKPLIHIEGSGNVTIEINGVGMTAVIDDYINIDCERMNAYRLPSENMNAYIQGTFPTLASGANTITITGTTTLVQITPHYFTI